MLCLRVGRVHAAGVHAALRGVLGHGAPQLCLVRGQEHRKGRRVQRQQLRDTAAARQHEAQCKGRGVQRQHCAQRSRTATPANTSACDAPVRACMQASGVALRCRLCSSLALHACKQKKLNKRRSICRAEQCSQELLMCRVRVQSGKGCPPGA
jgi:hypothetical protein